MDKLSLLFLSLLLFSCSNDNDKGLFIGTSWASTDTIDISSDYYEIKSIIRFGNAITKGEAGEGNVTVEINIDNGQISPYNGTYKCNGNYTYNENRFWIGVSDEFNDPFLEAYGVLKDGKLIAEIDFFQFDMVLLSEYERIE